MSRLPQKADQYAMKAFLGEINAQCGRYGYKSQRAFGDAIGVCQATARSYLMNPGKIPLDILRKIIKILQPNPVIVMKALGYSGKEIQRATDAITKSPNDWE